MKHVIIYALKDPLTHEIKYIGRTKNPLKYRMRAHYYTPSGIRMKQWIRELKLRRVKPLIEQLEQVNIEVWKVRESFWIKYYERKGDLININQRKQKGYRKSYRKNRR